MKQIHVIDTIMLKVSRILQIYFDVDSMMQPVLDKHFFLEEWKKGGEERGHNISVVVLNIYDCRQVLFHWC